MHARIGLRLASVADEPFLFELFRAVRAERFDFQPGGHPQMGVVARLQFQAREAAMESGCGESDRLLILVDGSPVGRLLVVRDGDASHVADLSILPAYQRKGIGSAVMKDLIAEAREAGLPIFTTILQGNTAAFQFFRKHGFEITGQDAGYVYLRARAAEPQRSSSGSR